MNEKQTKKEQIKKHKSSGEYQAALIKFSSLIWMIGFYLFGTLGFIGAYLTRQNIGGMISTGLFGILFTVLGVFRMRTFIASQDACIGYALGLNVDKRMIKEIQKANNKIFKLQYKIHNWKTFMSKEGQKKLNEENKNG